MSNRVLIELKARRPLCSIESAAVALYRKRLYSWRMQNKCDKYVTCLRQKQRYIKEIKDVIIAVLRDLTLF